MSDFDETREDSAHLLAATALSFVKTHTPSEVKDYLRRALRTKGSNRIPVAFYVAALRQAGSDALAVWFQSASVQAGLDIVDFAEGLRQATPEAALSLCRRYE